MGVIGCSFGRGLGSERCAARSSVRGAARVASIQVLLAGVVLAGCHDPVSPGVVDGPTPAPADSGTERPPPPEDSQVTAPPDRLRPAPFPLVLAHGFFGFEQVGPLDYFYGVRDALAAAGHEVYVTAVDPFNSTYARGPQLLAQVRAILATSGAQKVNIIGHSQGGLDARFVATHLPDRIGAVVTVSTPHRGTRVADVLSGATPGPVEELANAFIRAVAPSVYGDISDNADLQACLAFLSTVSLQQFNEEHPLPPTVAGFSLAGRSLLALAQEPCATTAPLFSDLAAARDPVDPLLAVTGAFLAGSWLHPEANDGLVTVKSSRWETWLGCVPADHFDEIGQLLGDSPGLGNPFDTRQLYLELASFLVQEGY